MTITKRKDGKPVYDNSYDRKLEESYESIKNRPAFSYDAGSDALYNKYKTDYISQGRRAMKDSAGQAAALTGGYGSSYSQAVGQQQYDSYLTKLGDVIPELYELAYSRYADEGERLRDSYESLRQLRDNEYSRYKDELSEYYDELDREYSRQRDAKEDEDKQRSSAVSEAAGRAKYGDFSGYAALYGDETAEKMRSYWISSNPETAYNMGLISAGRYYSMTGEYAPGFELPQPDSKTSSTYYPNTAPDGRDAKVVQRELKNMGYNIAVDGAWGPKSQAAWDKAYGKTGSGWIKM